MVQVQGEISQNVSKAYNAYHKTMGQTHRSVAAGTTAAVALCFGPVGWLYAGAATLGMLTSIAYGKRGKEAYAAVPLAYEVECLARSGYELVANDGSTVTLHRSSKKKGPLSDLLSS